MLGLVVTLLIIALIAAVLVWSGADLAVRPIKPQPQRRLRLGRGVGLSFFIGVLGGAVGVILGTLRMPALIRSVGMDVRRAAGTKPAAARPRSSRRCRAGGSILPPCSAMP